MKNILIIDVDSQRERQILFGKPSDVVLPKPCEESQIITNDIQTLVAALNQILIVSEREYLREEISNYLKNPNSLFINNELKI